MPERDERLDQVVLAYVKAADAGHAPDRQELLARHPDLAPELSEFFAGQDQFNELAVPLRWAREPLSLDRAATPLPEGTLPPEASSALRTAGLVVGDYELLTEIGRGGMGVVYQARQRSLGRLVALKMIRADQTAFPAEADLSPKALAAQLTTRRPRIRPSAKAATTSPAVRYQ